VVDPADESPPPPQAETATIEAVRTMSRQRIDETLSVRPDRWRSIREP